MKKISAIIVAGGRGERFNSEQKKQYLEIHGRSLLAWILKAFDEAQSISEVKLVCPEEDVAFVRSKVEKGVLIKKPIDFVLGGNSRQESVFNGLSSLREDIDVAVIHDAARPCISPLKIDEVARMAASTGAALLALKVTDSTFVGDAGTIETYLDRNSLWSAQTPQGFYREKITLAHKKAKEEGFFANDDGILYKKYIGDVVIVEGEKANIKVTFPADLIIAGEFLKDK